MNLTGALPQPQTCSRPGRRAALAVLSVALYATAFVAPTATQAAAGSSSLSPVTPEAFTQQLYLKASNAEGNDGFATSVAMSGNTLVVGAPREASCDTGVNPSTPGEDNDCEGAGAVYVFVRSGTTWTQQAYLKASNSRATSTFGWSVAIDGDTLVVGSNWESSCARNTDATPDQSDTGCSGAGSAYVFVRSGTTWTQQAYLKASNTDSYDNFGAAVSVSGDTVAIGAPYEKSCDTGANPSTPGEDNDCASAGAAYVFVRSGTTWTQQAYLKESDHTASDAFGESHRVSVSGDTVVVGSPNKDGQVGAVYVFVRSGTTWTQEQKLTASNAEAQDSVGYAVDIDGDTLIAGATGEDSCSVSTPSNNSCRGSGAAYVFTRSTGVWSQQAYLKSTNPDDGWTFTSDIFGYSVALRGDTALVGAPFEGSCSAGVDGLETQDDDNCAYAGAVFSFARSAGVWTKTAYLKASNNGAIPGSSPTKYNTPGFGETVATAGAYAAVGTPYERGCGKNTDATVDQWDLQLSCMSAGAAYVFNTGASSGSGEVTVTNTTEPLWKSSFTTAEVTLSATVVPSTVTPCEVEWTLDPDPGTGPYTAEVTGEEVSTTVDLPPGFYTVTVSVSGSCEASADSVLTGNLAVIGSRDGTSGHPHVDGSGKYTDPDTGKRASYSFHWEYDRYNNFKGRMDWQLFPSCGFGAPTTKSDSSYLCRYAEWRVYQPIDDEVTFGEGDDAITESSWGLVDCPDNADIVYPPAATPICSQISVKVRLQQRIAGVWTDSGEDVYMFLTLIEGRTIRVPYRSSFKSVDLPDSVAIKFQALDGPLPDGLPDVAEVLSKVGNSGVKHMKL